MPDRLMPYEDALAWVNEVTPQHLLVGNGFSMALDPSRFSYGALATKAEGEGLLPELAIDVMRSLGTADFESAMRALRSAVLVLKALNEPSFAGTVDLLNRTESELKDALARSIAGLHPDRPYDLAESRYRSVRRFLGSFRRIYSVNYDLLLYWALMQEIEDQPISHPSRAHDDGFRDPGRESETVVWDVYDPFSQTVFYLHGALHLFEGEGGLHKITWVRTQEALIDQVRAQLEANRFPLYVAESASLEKLTRINESGYLSRALRSLASIGGGLVVYGHSLDPNDDHVFEAVVRSNVQRMAVSIYGDAGSVTNQTIIERAKRLASMRVGSDLELAFYSAESVHLWEQVDPGV